MSLITRQFGPTPKNVKLSIEEMDNNLLYLESLAQSGFGNESNNSILFEFNIPLSELDDISDESEPHTKIYEYNFNFSEIIPENMSSFGWKEIYIERNGRVYDYVDTDWNSQGGFTNGSQLGGNGLGQTQEPIIFVNDRITFFNKNSNINYFLEVYPQVTNIEDEDEPGYEPDYETLDLDNLFLKGYFKLIPSELLGSELNNDDGGIIGGQNSIPKNKI
jgi:hypothetical protein